MAYSFTVNQTPATGAESVYNIKTRLVAAGWVVKASGNGTTYSASSDVVTSAALMNAGLAWFRISDPAGVRELTFQRGPSGNAATYWRIKYSASAKFTGGSPSATQTPSATDEQIIFGSGTDASPSMFSWFYADGSYRQNIGADSAAPYTFWMTTFPNGGGPANIALVFDYVNSPSPGDADPTIIYIGVATPVLTTSSLCSSTAGGNTSHCVGYLKKGLAGEGFVVIPANTFYSSGGGQLAPNNAGTNPQNGKDDEFPILFGRATSLSVPNGYKGLSSVMKWHGTSRTTGDTLNVAAPKDRIIMGDVSLPWDGATTPVM